MTIGLLLEKDFDINAHPWGYSPLMYAVRFGNWAAVPFLIWHGADVNIPDDEGNPPVVWAASAGQADVVNCLIGGTQNLNTTGSRTGMTPLMWAVYSEYDHPEIIQAFIDKGADVNQRSKDGKTALGWALQKGNTKTVRAAIVNLVLKYSYEKLRFFFCFSTPRSGYEGAMETTNVSLLKKQLTKAFLLLEKAVTRF